MSVRRFNVCASLQCLCIASTLTNTDNKILAKVLAERLGGVIPKLVSEDQVGYNRGKNIATVIRTTDDVINYLDRTKKAAYILAVDFRKAFDFL